MEDHVPRHAQMGAWVLINDRWYKFSGKAFDKAIYGLRDILQAYEILGWHCTRLTDAEVDEILRDGMELPNAEMLIPPSGMPDTIERNA